MAVKRFFVRLPKVTIDWSNGSPNVIVPDAIDLPQPQLWQTTGPNRRKPRRINFTFDLLTIISDLVPDLHIRSGAVSMTFVSPVGSSVSIEKKKMTSTGQIHQSLLFGYPLSQTGNGSREREYRSENEWQFSLIIYHLYSCSRNPMSLLLFCLLYPQRQMCLWHHLRPLWVFPESGQWC